ncbi:hypothetical protein JOL62DRAFT_560513 [Phyllosticta paracitricarpa]|uniref:Uncharacterized protein n=1 Tax=Phyllosticta paracitricarpa TaxID=2016321 RepID=A0ABR1MSV8_9PEZI
MEPGEPPAKRSASWPLGSSTDDELQQQMPAVTRSQTAAARRAMSTFATAHESLAATAHQRRYPSGPERHVAFRRRLRRLSFVPSEEEFKESGSKALGRESSAFSSDSSPEAADHDHDHDADADAQANLGGPAAAATTVASSPKPRFSYGPSDFRVLDPIATRAFGVSSLLPGPNGSTAAVETCLDTVCDAYGDMVQTWQPEASRFRPWVGYGVCKGMCQVIDAKIGNALLKCLNDEMKDERRRNGNGLLDKRVCLDREEKKKKKSD